LQNQEFVDEQLNKIMEEVDAITHYSEGNEVSLRNIGSTEKLRRSLLEDYQWRWENLTEDNEDEILSIVVEIGNINRKYIANFGAVGEKLLNAIVFAANKPFLYEIPARVKAEGYDEFLLVCFSNRQSMAVDKFNATKNCTEFFCKTLIALEAKFNEILESEKSGVRCQLDKFLMADIYGDHKAGVSFQRIIDELAGKDVGEEHSYYIYDARKFSLLYAIMHYLASSRCHHNITAIVMDDMEDIYTSLMAAFSDHDVLVPKNISLENWPYEGDFPVNKYIETNDVEGIAEGEIFTLQGAGPLDFNFAKNVFKIAELSGSAEGKLMDSLASMNIEKFKRERQLKKVVAYNSGVTLFDKKGHAITTMQFDDKEKKDLSRINGMG
jgi:hypothetical protein